ncbi:YHS domain-containing (seleno)protein [Saccharophagus degradans]|uniref:YHS n=1 Tax=Saccharophagus degradans (strain 2-40 / ATCC 43961 / DSM 17024) TaxID=203122 RepID=Q21DY4_SACD2|nr:YHS domain-containing (seleno)protein [Saccharophagus degradans]ABD83095.1 hypothetical protein Sde_3840 [Saccharophagus degradans 2-40]
MGLGIGRKLGLHWWLLLCFSVSALAADPPIYSHAKHGAIKGYDVVAYYSLQPGDDAVKGSDEFTYNWNGATWKFANAKNLALFTLNPENYAPQYGGYCSFAVAHGYVTSIRPDSWKIVNGKLYLNYSRFSFKRWEKDMNKKIAEADANWPAVLTVCEERGNCK